jgi:hypothetical protein
VPERLPRLRRRSSWPPRRPGGVTNVQPLGEPAVGGAQRRSTLAVWLIDDGCGFDPGQAAGAMPGQLGLVSAERAAFAGGTLEVGARAWHDGLPAHSAGARRASPGPEPAVAS